MKTFIKLLKYVFLINVVLTVLAFLSPSILPSYKTQIGTLALAVNITTVLYAFGLLFANAIRTRRLIKDLEENDRKDRQK